MSLPRRCLHLVHGYNEPFLSLSNQYSLALQSDGWHVTTVYLTGRADPAVRAQTAADAVIFLDTPDRAMKGLKLGLLWRVRRLLGTGVQLILAQRYKSLYLALLGSVGTGIPVIGVAHAFGVLKSASRRRLLARFHHRLTLVGVSEAVTHDLRASNVNLHLLALHNCIDTIKLEARLQPRPYARQQLQLPDDAFVFANVGRLHADKDQPTLLRAFARIAHDYPQARLLLIGKGRREAEYRALVEQLGLQGRAIVTGPVPEAATLFSAFDTYVSASDREPFGIVLTEAMLARVPVISTDCGGAPEVLGEHGRYFTRGDDAALATQMVAMMALPAAERAALGEQLYQRLQQHFAFAPFRERLLAIVHKRVSSS